MQAEVGSYSPAELALFRCVDGRYRLLAQLGTGRHGQVYLAYDLLSGEFTALKEPLDLSVIDRPEAFLAEIAKMVYLREKGKTLAVTQIRDFNFDVREGLPVVYYTMDFAPLGEFFSFLESSPLIDEDSVRFFFAQLVEVVAGLHSLGLAHLDLKPENILLKADSSLLLCDLGSAAWTERGDAFVYAGSKEYCAPEACAAMAHGESFGAEIDLRRLDTFSLGVILFVALFKSNPFMSAEPSDPYYRRLLYDREAFWEIFAPLREITPAARLFLEELLLSPPAQRPLVQALPCSQWVSGLPANANFQEALASSVKDYRDVFEDNLLREIRAKLKREGEAERFHPKARLRQFFDSAELVRRFIRQNEEKISRLRKTLGKLSPLKPQPSRANQLRKNF